MHVTSALYEFSAVVFLWLTFSTAPFTELMNISIANVTGLLSLGYYGPELSQQHQDVFQSRVITIVMLQMHTATIW